MEIPEKVAVLGLGASGEAAARLLLRLGRNVVVYDSADTPALRERALALEEAGACVRLGAKRCEPGPGLAVLSPGIDAAAPLPSSAAGAGLPLMAEIELGFALCRCPVAAITGTNGKTTTTSLAHHLLHRAGVRCRAAGNIGTPFCEVVAESESLDWVVLEVSSFQLETIRAFRPRIAAFLNFSPNHLDRYRCLQDYFAAKLRIFENQRPEDFAVVQAGLGLPPLAARQVTFSARRPADWTLCEGWVCRKGERVMEMAATRLAGPHNAENAMAALALGECAGADVAKMAAAALDFQPPPHRCELVRELGGVRWVNDSKATTLDAMAKALGGQPGPVVLIAGGKDKGFDFDALLPLVKGRVRLAVLIGEMRERIARSWPGVPCRLADSLEEAVAAAREAAQPGDTVLFSPGTSSFDMFRDYAERGLRFREAVEALPSNPSHHL